MLRLDPGETKGNEAREVYLNAECLRDISLLFAARGNCPYVFHKGGKKIGDFRKAWATACKKAGVEGKLFHDLRRTAVRDLVRSGVPDRVAMQITGHKTREVFDRYNIVSREDLRKATDQRGRHHERITCEEKVANTGFSVSASA